MTGLILVSDKYSSYVSLGKYGALHRIITDQLPFTIKACSDINPASIKEDVVMLHKGIWKHHIGFQNLHRLPRDKKLVFHVSDIHSCPDIEKDIKRNTPYHEALLRLFDRADMILSAYNHAFRIRYPEYVEKMVFFPHFAPSRLANLKPAGQINKVLLSGCVCNYYPLREYLAGIDSVDQLKHPGYGAVPSGGSKTGDSYYRFLSNYKCCIATSSILNYVVSKYFEIPASGSILIANYTPDLDILGFQANKHYVKITKETCIEAIEGAVSGQYDHVSGRKFVLEHHTEINRFKQFKRLLCEL